MKFMNAAEMQALLPQSWGAESPGDAAIIRAAVDRRPEHMRRIHDIVALTRPPFDGKPFLYRTIAGKQPVEWLAEGDTGILALDAYLVGHFQKSAPRDIFDVPGAHPEPELEGIVLLNLLWDREGSLPGGSGTIHDPIKFDRKVLADGTRRLAVAIQNYLQREDNQVACRILMVALRDDDPVIRLAALATSGWLTGYPEVHQAIAAVREDVDSKVKIAAIKALGVRAEMPQMVGEIAEFLHDEDAAVREAAVRVFLNRHMAPGSLAPMARAVFDPNQRVAEVAALVIPDEEITALIRRLARAAEAGERIDRADLAKIAASDLQDYEKVRIFAGRIVRLSERGGEESEYGDVLESLLAWPEMPSDDMFVLLGEMPPITDNGGLGFSMMSLARRCRTPAAWKLLKAFLTMPKGKINYGAQAGIAETAGVIARDLPDILEGMLEVAEDRSVDPLAREAVIFGLAKAGPNREIVTRLSTLALSQEQPARLAKAAAMVVAGGLMPADRVQFLKAVASSAVKEVAEYAGASLQGIATPGAIPEAEAPKIVDIREARKRRLRNARRPVDKD